MVEHGWRRAGGVAVRSDVVGRQYEAVIHISRADDVLIDLVCFQVPPGSSGHHPVRRYFHRGTAQKSFTAGEISQLSLRGVIAVHHADRPAIEGRAAFSLETVDVERGLVQSRANAKSIGAVGRVVGPGDIVRTSVLKPGVHPG